MSQCPFAAPLMKVLKQVDEKLGAGIDLRVDYVGTTSEEGELSSLRGPAEVTGDVAQLCAMKHGRRAWLDLAICQGNDLPHVDTNWEACANVAKLPVGEFAECVKGPEGRDLLAASFSRAADRGAKASPLLFIAGKSHAGRRSANALMRAICAQFGAGPPPAACSKVPPPIEVNVLVLDDSRCPYFHPDNNRIFVEPLATHLERIKVLRFDYQDARGKALYQTLLSAIRQRDPEGAVPLPAVLFDGTLDKDPEAAEALSRRLWRVGPYRLLSVGSYWFPDCAEKGGCSLPQCQATLGGRKKIPHKLDVFVRSPCLFAAEALGSIQALLPRLKPLSFSVHYIASGDAAKGFVSLGGPAEVDEDIRALCAIQHYSADYKFLEYLTCRRNAARDQDWEKCTDANGIEAAVLRRCFETEGRKLLQEDLKLAQHLGISTSPTWLANNNSEFGGLDADAIHARICEANDDLAECR